METQPPVYAIGDVHGQWDKLVQLLTGTGLIDESHHWAGEQSELWLLGDFVDRGSSSVDVLDLVMGMQREAPEVGGRVYALLGNHDVTLLAARRFGAERSTGPGGTFARDWERNGGNGDDLQRLTDAHVEWIMSLPAMAHGHDHLFVHADATFYDEYGASVAEVNNGIQALLDGGDTSAWDRLLHRFSDREAFVEAAQGGTDKARRFLERYEGKQLIHGHTPIDKITRQPPEDVTEALVYAEGLCVDVDGGMYRGGPGFVYPVVSSGVTLV